MTPNWHIGQSPDQRSIQIAKKYGIDITMQRARQIRREDLVYYNRIFVMDRENLHHVRGLTNDVSLASKVALLANPEEIPDPYYDNDLFESVFKQVYRACTQMLDEVSLIKK